MKGEVWIPINFNLDFAPKEWQDIMSIEFSTAWNSRVTLEEIHRELQEENK